VVIIDERGEEQHLSLGDMAFFPARSVSTWYVPVHVRKLAVLHHAIPVSLNFALRALRRARRSLPSKYIVARPGIDQAEDDGTRLQSQKARK
jgi:hypothetical protein